MLGAVPFNSCSFLVSWQPLKGSNGFMLQHPSFCIKTCLAVLPVHLEDKPTVQNPLVGSPRLSVTRLECSLQIKLFLGSACSLIISSLQHVVDAFKAVESVNHLDVPLLVQIILKVTLEDVSSLMLPQTSSTLNSKVISAPLKPFKPCKPLKNQAWMLAM